MRNLQKIDINSIPERIVNINDFSQEYKIWMNESNLLLKKSSKYTSKGTFESNIWILLEDVTKTHHHYDFRKLQIMVQKGTLTDDDIMIIKCWMVDSLRENISLRTLDRMFSAVSTIISATNNFNLVSLNAKNGDEIETLLAKVDDNSHLSYYASEYIYFLDNIDLLTEGHLIVLDKLRSVKSYTKSKMRVLPSSEDIFAFQYYLNKFYTKESNEYLLNFYMPVLLWWKITNVIPMRPSEFSYKLKRSCLSIKDGEYFLHIARLKVTSSNPERKDGRIPLLSKIKITKEIYDLICDYIESTAFDTETETLISYKAMLKFRKDFYENKFQSDINLRYAISIKKYNNTFTRQNLKLLIDSFYDVIIAGKYKYSNIKRRLLPGDTRHLAFTSLLLQGVSPIEIAMLGGHTTLDAQSDYSSHVEYYIDSEILNFIGSINVDTFVTNKRLKDIIMNKPFTCPRFIADCSPTEDGIGYCTIDMENGVELCDNVEYCIYCDKWWCDPTNENYLKAKNYIQNSSLGPLKRVIQEEEQFLRKLLSEAKVENIEGLLELNKETEEAIKQAVLKLKSSADRIIFYKKSLLNVTNK